MAGYTKSMERIIDTLGSGSTVRVLLVEGEDDVAFFRSMLDKVAPAIWSNSWAVHAADGKTNVLKILDAQTNWIGIVDRDEWDPARITHEQGVAVRADRLHVLPRFCMESYMVHGPEIWAALPALQQAKLQGGESLLTQQLQQNLPAWLRHGALWHVINPLWDGLRVVGFKDALLDLSNAQSDDDIQQTLQDWDDVLNPTTIWSSFQSKLTTVNSANDLAKVTKWVHGKKYFKENVQAVLNTNFGQRSADIWFRDLQRDMPVPADLDFLWTAMGLP